MGPRASALVEDLVQHLRARLLAGDFAAGDRVSESGVAGEYGVARPTARAALEILLDEGLLTRQAYSAMRVPAITRAELPEVLGLLEYVETAALGSALATNADIRRLRDAASLSLHQFLAALVEAGGSERLARIHRRCTFELVLGLHQAGSSDVGIDSVPLEARTTLATALFERDDATARAVLAGLHGARRAAAGHPLATDSHQPEARR